MKVFRNAFEAGRWAPEAVVVLGKFDGLHVGHQRLIRAALKKARAAKTRCLVVTLDPVPEQFLRLYPYRPLLSEAEKIELMGKLGVDGVVLIPFDEDFACLVPRAFADMVLAAQLKCREVFVGADFCFGKDRAGRVGDLEGFGGELGFKVHALPLARVGGEKVTAQRIRSLIDAGRTKEAEALLGWRLKDA